AGSVKFEVFESSDCSGTAIYTQTVSVSGASPQTVSTTNTTVSTTAANISWRLTYTSTNPAQRDIPATCLERSTLTIDNDGTAPSPYPRPRDSVTPVAPDTRGPQLECANHPPARAAGSRPARTAQVECCYVTDRPSAS